MSCFVLCSVAMLCAVAIATNEVFNQSLVLCFCCVFGCSLSCSALIGINAGLICFVISCGFISLTIVYCSVSFQTNIYTYHPVRIIREQTVFMFCIVVLCLVLCFLVLYCSVSLLTNYTGGNSSA